MALHRIWIAVKGEDPRVGVGGGFADGEVLRARGDIRVCLAEVVSDLEATGRRLGKGGHLRVPDVLPHAHGVVGVPVAAIGVDVRDVHLRPRGQRHLVSGVLLHPPAAGDLYQAVQGPVDPLAFLIGR